MGDNNRYIIMSIQFSQMGFPIHPEANNPMGEYNMSTYYDNYKY